MDKCIIFALIAFAAFVCASAKPGYSSPSYSAHIPVVYGSPVLAQPAAAPSLVVDPSAVIVPRNIVPPSAAAYAAIASSAAVHGSGYSVPSYIILDGNSGDGHYNNYVPY